LDFTEIKDYTQNARWDCAIGESQRRKFIFFSKPRMIGVLLVSYIYLGVYLGCGMWVA
jgi:hypothetical protein